jgi:hypothetical protein
MNKYMLKAAEPIKTEDAKDFDNFIYTAFS